MIEIIPNWHPLFVHFTVALLSLSVLFFILEKPLHETEYGDNFLVFARYCLWLGVLISFITVLAGWDAYNTVDHDTPSHEAMTAHRNVALITFGLFIAAAIWLAASSALRECASWIFIGFLLIATGMLIVTGNKGAELVYQFGLGVESLPKKEAHGHAPGHAHDHSNDSSAHPHSGDDHQNHEPAHSDSHDHQHTDTLGPVDTQAPADMTMDNMAMPEEMPTVEFQSVDAPIVETDEDGISRQELLPELPPTDTSGAASATPAMDDGHDHSH